MARIEIKRMSGTGIRVDNQPDRITVMRRSRDACWKDSQSRVQRGINSG